VPAASSAARPPIAAPVKAVVPAPVDSVAIKHVADSIARARALLRQRKDSIKAAKAASAAVAARPGSVESAITRYARAIESGAVDRLKEAYPELTDEQQKFWESNVFARATRIKATVVDLKTTTDGDAAEASFRLNVTFDYATGASRGSIPLEQHASLRHIPSGWQIVKIR
jgi:hypothetical protein